MVMSLNTRSSMQLAETGRGTAVRTQFLTFNLGGEVYALEIRQIREILQFDGLTEVPLMPAFIRGVINLRGSVVPVIDLHVRFGKTPTEVARRTCIVIVEAGQEDAYTVLGVMVDHVSEVLEIDPTDIEAAPAFGSGLRADFIRGVGKVSGHFVVLLDIDHVLSVEEMASIIGQSEGRDSGLQRNH